MVISSVKTSLLRCLLCFRHFLERNTTIRPTGKQLQSREFLCKGTSNRQQVELHNTGPELLRYQLHVDVSDDKAWVFYLLLGICGWLEEGCLYAAVTEAFRPTADNSLTRKMTSVTKEHRRNSRPNLHTKTQHNKNSSQTYNSRMCESEHRKRKGRWRTKRKVETKNCWDKQMSVLCRSIPILIKKYHPTGRDCFLMKWAHINSL
jgi:hypothetical protein